MFVIVTECGIAVPPPPTEAEHVMTMHVLADLFSARSVLNCTDTLKRRPTCSACFYYVSELRWCCSWMIFAPFDAVTSLLS